MSERLPLPMGFSAALAEAARALLRALQARHGLSSDHPLAVPLERLQGRADGKRQDAASCDWTALYLASGADRGGR